MIRRVMALTATLIALGGMAFQADRADAADWRKVEAAARGQTIYWHAWGGEPRINDYIAWVGQQTKARFGVSIIHVKLADTAEAVSRVLAEKAAGTLAGGAVDLIWINGENFAAMKREGLLGTDSWADTLPNFPLTDPDNNPAVAADFTIPTDGLEAPWGKAQLVFYTDGAEVRDPPKSMAGLLAWAKANPGRFAYPLPPDFLGSTFLKQALLDLSQDSAPLYSPVEAADFEAVTAPLWHFLEELHPALWRQGRAFPKNSADLRRLLADREISIGFAFNPAEPSAAIANGELPDTVRSYVLSKGTVGNMHFVTIPFNATNRAGALVVANFLLSPEAQAHKQDPQIWGDFTVLAHAKLSGEDRARFDAIDLGPATLSPAELGAPIPEPHPSWMVRIEKEWVRRYGAS